MSEQNLQVILDRAVAPNRWQIILDAEQAASSGGATDVLPLATWLAKVSRGGTAPGAIPGVWLAPEDDPAAIADALNGQINAVPLIAIQFPKFVEGRGYSSAYLVRQRLGYRGELRAFGDIGRDHVWQLQRVGFTSLDLRAGTDLNDALAAFADFPERYQNSADIAEPLFRRRCKELAGV